MKYVFITLIVYESLVGIKASWQTWQIWEFSSFLVNPFRKWLNWSEQVQKFQFKSAVQINSTVKFKKVSSHKIPFSIISGWNKLLCYGMPFISYLFYWFIVVLGKINGNGLAHRTFPFSWSSILGNLFLFTYNKINLEFFFLNIYLQVEYGKCVSRVMLRIFENSVGESIELTLPKFYCVKEEDPIEYI